MSRSLFMTLFLFGCAGAATPPPGQPPLPIDHAPSGEASSARSVEPGVTAPAPWVAGDLELYGVTSDDRVVYFDRSARAVRMIALDGNRPETLADGTPDQVRIDGQVVFVWSNGTLTARTRSGTRTVSDASYAGLAAASADGTALLYAERSSNPPSAGVYLESAYGRSRICSFDDPTQVRLRFAVDLWAMVTVLVAGESGFTIAIHPSGSAVMLGTDVGAEPVLDASGLNVLMIDTAGNAMLRRTLGGLPVTLDQPVAQAAFAGEDVVYRTPGGMLDHWSDVQGPTALFASAAALVAVAPDGAHLLAQDTHGGLEVISTDGRDHFHLVGAPAPGASFTRDGRWVIFAPHGEAIRGLAIAPVTAGSTQRLSIATTRVETGHDGVIVFDDAGTLRLGDTAAGFRGARALGTGVTGFRLDSAGDRAVFTTATGLHITASF